MDILISNTVYGHIVLDYLGVRLSWFHDGLREFCELFLDVAKTGIIFWIGSIDLLIMMFLELLINRYDMIDGRTDGSADVTLIFFLNRGL